MPISTRTLSILAGVAVVAATLAWVAQGSAQRQRGAALFAGEAALSGRIVGHDVDLPVQASRCVNCHGEAGRPAPAASAPTLAPALDARSLAAPTPRRGGPPSRYDAAALCTLLRSGVDPAHVMIPRTMPRYTLSDEDCAALWAHLGG